MSGYSVHNSCGAGVWLTQQEGVYRTQCSPTSLGHQAAETPLCSAGAETQSSAGAETLPSSLPKSHGKQGFKHVMLFIWKFQGLQETEEMGVV